MPASNRVGILLSEDDGLLENCGETDRVLPLLDQLALRPRILAG
jgi:hypothetical protein